MQPSIVRYRAQFGLSFLKDSYVINLQIENKKNLFNYKYAHITFCMFR